MSIRVADPDLLICIIFQSESMADDADQHHQRSIAGCENVEELTKVGLINALQCL